MNMKSSLPPNSATLRGRLLEYLRPYMRRTWVGVAFGVCEAALQAVVVLELKAALDALKESHVNLRQLDVALALIPLAFAIKGVCGYFQKYFTCWAGLRAVTDLRNELYAHLGRLSLRFFEGSRVGELMSGVLNDVAVIQNALTNNIMLAVTAPLEIVAYFGIAIWINARLSLTLLVLLIPIAIVIRRLGGKVRRAAGALQDAQAEVSSVLEETLAGARIVKAFDQEKREQARFAVQNEDAFRAAMRQVRITGTQAPAIELLGAVGVVAILYFCGPLVAHHQISLPSLLILYMAFDRIASSAQGLGSLNNAYQQTLNACERVFARLDEVPDIQDRPDARPLPRIQGRLEFQDVHFTYDGRTPVLQGISFTARPGECIALVGESGAGKSTIASLVSRFYDPTAGSVTVDGQDLRAVTVSSLRRQIGLVPQETILFRGSVRDNIAYGRPEAPMEEIVAAAVAANAHRFIEALPQGYGELLGERGAKLSGGQRQRIAIARAVLNDPRILVLDEATSSLDTESERLVQEALERLMQNRTTLVIAHRLSTVRRADRILVLEHGTVMEEGRHDELLARGGIYTALHQGLKRDRAA